MFQRSKESFSEREERVLTLWREKKIFEASLKARRKNKHFSFYDGPPFATGLPHYGHILAGTLKDVVARYKTMKGFCVPRRFGWDCHGLPVENEIEKMHNLSGAVAIEEYGIARFNEECRKIVLRYVEEWKSTVERMGRWVEFDRTYKTMDISYMESVWWVFGQLYEKGLIYEGFKVMHYSPKLGTPISNFEANLNYQDVDDPSLTVRFKLRGGEGSLLVWTTTPWTLPMNLAVCVGPEIDYVKIRVKESNEVVILAQDRLGAYFEPGSYHVLSEMKGIDLKGLSYEPLFPYFADHSNAFVVLNGEFVSTDEGSGVVHMAPGFGEDDMAACKAAEIDVVCPVDVNCRYTHEVSDFEGQFVKDADKEIIRRLKSEGKVFKHATIHHRYPFCWRTDAPLIYRAVTTWFVAVEKVKEKILANNHKVHWVPDHIKTGRFGKWLENARDWAVSRNRFWGTPIPIWRSEDGDIRVISSISQLEEKTGIKIDDLHRHFIDHLDFVDGGKKFVRVNEVFDCWFESGSMPYAQNHYPFENKKETEKEFPADFIAEGLDQTRGWFYTLMVLSTILFDEPAFKNVIVNGIVLAEDGQKMSKRLKNYPEPGIVINKYGADAIRLYLLNSPVVRADDISFSERGVEGVMRQVMIPLYNCYAFLATYAEIYKWDPKGETFSRPTCAMDKWILSHLQTLIEDVDKGMDQYHLDNAVSPFVGFLDELTNWYIRRSRSRFWSDEESDDRREAFETLYTVLLTLVKIAAPYTPFIAEAIYQELKQGTMPESVHLCDFPVVNEQIREAKLEKEMKYTQEIVGAGHSLRKEHKIKVRQPLGQAHIVSSNLDIIDAVRDQADLIREELNVKEISFNFDETKFVKLRPKPNFRVLGKKVGKFMNEVKEQIEQLDQRTLQKIFDHEIVEIAVGEEVISLTEEDVMIERQVHDGLIAAVIGDITIALDTHLTDELIQEGIVREIINKVNTLRKTQGFEVTDRISLTLETTPSVRIAFEKYADMIKKETLTVEVSFAPCEGGEEVDLNDNPSKIGLTKVGTQTV